MIIAVRDAGSPTIPYPRRPADDEPSGRGLTLVNTLATRWGFHRDPTTGTTVWFMLT